MGCDIHLYVEKRTDGVWRELHQVPPYDCTWCDGKKINRQGDACWRCKGLGKQTEPWDNRNYDVFAMLADVRNGYGFAGCDTGDGFRPIASPRGLPLDVSKILRVRADEYGADGHSHSWLLLSELDRPDYYRQVTIHRGVVTPAAYAKWLAAGANARPDRWCGGVSGRDTHTVNRSDMDHLIRLGVVRTDVEEQDYDTQSTHGTDGNHYYTSITWSEPYAASAAGFLRFVRALRELDASPDDVRIVFWFDN